MSPWSSSDFSTPYHATRTGEGILILTQRTALVAKQTGRGRLLSGGRLRLGIGIGWNYVEYDASGSNFRRGDAGLKNRLRCCARTQPLVTHKTAHHVIDNAGINPPRVQRPIPIWFGGAAEPALAALHGSVMVDAGWSGTGRPR